MNEELRGVPATAISVSRYASGAESHIGFCHSVNLYSDGDWEDTWGKQASANILTRYWIQTYILSEAGQQKVIRTLQTNSPAEYAATEELAGELLAAPGTNHICAS